MELIRIRYDYHPVGQGLFTSSRLEHGHFSKPFSWVFDCGTTSSQSLIDAAIPSAMAGLPVIGDKPRFDLVVISHFDNDHISGLVRLLSQVNIDILLLPYLPLWQRLLLAFEERVEPDDPFFAFFTNPLGFLRATIGEGAVRRILFVPASDEEGGPVPDEGGPPEPPGEGLDDDGWRLDIDKDDPPDDIAEDPAMADELTAAGGPSAGFLRPGGGLRLRGYWEFLPYNDAKVARQGDISFRARVAEHRDNLIARDADDETRAEALTALKAAYDAEFGADSVKRNIVSLFLYAGPLGRWTDAVSHVFGRILKRSLLRCGTFRASQRGRFYPVAGNRFAQLFTGDGYLDTPERLQRLIANLKPHRLARLGVLQVMHHGAERNWQIGTARALAPSISIFSSDPAHRKFRHPHAPVVRDFFRQLPLQVDRSHGAAVDGLLVR
jgi:hypothetical protein